MSLYPIDNYPRDEASGIPRNASVWVQFNKTLNVETVSYLTVSVASIDDGYIPLDGTVETKASSSGIADTLVKFIPDPAFDPYKRYGLFIAGGQEGIKAYDGEILERNLEYYFIIGSGVTSNPDVAASGVPEISGYLPTVNLQVLSTTPSNYATNIPIDSPYIKIQLNDSIASGINLYEYITITKKDVL